MGVVIYVVTIIAIIARKGLGWVNRLAIKFRWKYRNNSVFLLVNKVPWGKIFVWGLFLLPFALGFWLHQDRKSEIAKREREEVVSSDTNTTKQAVDSDSVAPSLK